jgi:LytS/YehU family sensor histidine kinase
MQRLESKALIFAAIMASLGNALSFLSTQLAPIAPNIPLGPIQVSLALDFSHLSTFIAALFGGPVVGGLTGLVGGLVAAFEFGFSKGNLVTGFGLPLGKALTGITAGFLFSKLYNSTRTRMIISTVVSYIPEGLLTIVLFRYLLPLYIALPKSIATTIGVQIVIKAFIEMIILGVLLIVINNNLGFKSYVKSYFN